MQETIADQTYTHTADSRMNKFDEAEKAIAELLPGEKMQLLASVVHDLGESFSGIDSSPNVCGGESCIVRTRIPVWVLEQGRRLGSTEVELLQSFPTLRAADLVNAWAYVRARPDEIDRQIRENEEAT